MLRPSIQEGPRMLRSLQRNILGRYVFARSFQVVSDGKCLKALGHILSVTTVTTLYI